MKILIIFFQILKFFEKLIIVRTIYPNLVGIVNFSFIGKIR